MPRRKGARQGSRTLLLAGWHILVTNIPAEKVSAEGLAAIYSQRWQIEIVFRGWKQATRQDNVQPDPRHVQTQKRKRKSLALTYFDCLG